MGSKPQELFQRVGEAGDIPGAVGAHDAVEVPRAHPLDRAALGVEQLAVETAALRRQVHHQRSDVRRVPLVEAPIRRRHDVVQPGAGHRQAGAGRRGDAVAPHVVAGQFLRRDLGERGDARLGGAVVRLPRVGHQPRRRRGVDDPTRPPAVGFVLGAPERGGEPRRREVTLEVHADDVVPLVLGHVDDQPVAQDAGVVDEDVEVRRGRRPWTPPGTRRRPTSTRRRRWPTPVPPCSSISATTAAAAPGSAFAVDVDPSSAAPTSFTTTVAPSAARRRAYSRPRPRPAPVTIAIRPSSAPIAAET